MNRTTAMAWVLSICIDQIRLSQAKTLAACVAAALFAPRLTLAGVGREMQGKAYTKHKIKRIWRWITNPSVEPMTVMCAAVNRLLGRHLKRLKNKPLLVSFDWTQMRQVPTLMAAVVVQGRCIPICWGCYQNKTLGKSQNALEEALLFVLRDILGTQVRIILLADRGFGRADLGRFCQQLRIDYVIRIKSKVFVRFNGQAVRLDRYPVHRGVCEFHRHVLYRQHDPVHQHIVIYWKRGLPKKSDQPWYLMTNLEWPGSTKQVAARLCQLYGKRFDIEEFFRDTKCGQFGYALSQTRITRPERLERLLLILVLAYLILIAIGLWIKRNWPAKQWASNNRINECSAFTVARVMIHHPTTSLKQLILQLVDTIINEMGNWG